MFDALFFPTGNEAYAKSLEAGRVIHFVREAFGHFKPSMFRLVLRI